MRVLRWLNQADRCNANVKLDGANGMWLFAAFLLGCFVSVFLFMPQAQAQSNPPAIQLTLTDDNDTYDVAPFTYVTPDPDKDVGYKALINNYLRGDRGEASESALIQIDSTGVAHWLVISVYNRSKQEDWVLSFGSHLDGRMGAAQNIFLYDHISKKKYIDTVTSKGNSFTPELPPESTDVPLKLLRGQKALLVMYIEPVKGLPLIMPITLKNKETVKKLGVFNLFSMILPCLFVILVIGFMLASILTLRMWGGIFIILYFIMQAGVFFIQNFSIYEPMKWAALSPGLLFNASAIFALISSIHFLSIGKLQRLQLKIVLFFVLVVGASVLASRYYFDAGDPFHPFLTFGPGILVYIFLSLLSLAQGYNGRPGAFMFSLGWVIICAGVVVTFLSSFGFMEPQPIFVAAYWWAMVPQALIFMLSISMRQSHYIAGLSAKVQEEAEEIQVVARIRQTKEATEIERLNRVLEHERQFMNEMQNREVQQNEELRRAKEIADEANRAKSAFLAVVSHEIRTPMTGVMGMVRLMLDTPLTPDQKQYLQTVQDSGDAMMTLLNDILDFEKIESGKLDIEYIDFEVQRLLSGVITLMSGHAAQKKIDLTLDVDEKMPKYLIGDPVRLRQILLNLTGNAIKFTDTGGVTVRAMVRNYNPDENMYRLHFSVKDTGIGISEDGKKKLFSPFEQTDSSISRKFGGTGLGLAISQRLVEAMGGKIDIESIEGEGSDFYFEIEMKSGTEANVEDLALPSAASGSGSGEAANLHILIVEDNEINQRLMKELIERQGHTTDIAGTGAEALEKAQSTIFDLILMDMQLPDILGVDVTRQVRAMDDKSIAEVPILALSGNVRPEDIQECEEAGMNGHISKPVDPKKLQRKIQELVPEAAERPAAAPVSAPASSGAMTPPAASAHEEDSADTIPQAKPLDEAQPAAISVAKEDVEAETFSLSDNKGHAGSTLTKPDDNQVSESAKKEENASASDGKLYKYEPSPQEIKDDQMLESLLADETPVVSVDDLQKIASDEQNPQGGEVSANTAAPQPDMTGHKPCDYDMLKTLKGDMGMVQFSTLMESVFEKTEEILEQMEGARGDEDANSIKLRAHELKGMAGNFGLAELAALSGEIEKLAGQEEPDLVQIDPFLTKLPDANKRAIESFEGWMKDDG